MADAAHRRRDLYAGGLIALIGLGAAAEAQTYDVGTLTNMGPGFLPIALGIVLISVGVMIALGLSRSPDDADDIVLPGHMVVGPLDWRGASAIIVGVVAFIALGAYVGLIPAILACVFISAFGDRTTTLRGAAILALSITVLGTVVFSYLLKVPFPLIRW